MKKSLIIIFTLMSVVIIAIAAAILLIRESHLDQNLNNYDLLQISIGFGQPRSMIYEELYNTQEIQQSKKSYVKLVSYNRTDNYFPYFVYFLPLDVQDSNVVHYYNCDSQCIGIEIKSYDPVTYEKPTVSINSSLPLFIEDADHYGYKGDYVIYSERHICTDTNYNLCSIEFRFDQNLFYTSKLFFNICYGPRLKNEIPEYDYDFEYSSKYGDRNLDILEIPFYENATKKVDILLNGIKIQELNILFDPVRRSRVCQNE